MAKIDYDVGDLVVCVDDRGSSVAKGTVYTVTRVENFHSRSHPILGREIGLAVYLKELEPHPGKFGFHPLRFRKLPRKPQEFFAGSELMVDA